MAIQNKIRPVALVLSMFAFGSVVAPSMADAAPRRHTPIDVGCFDDGTCFIELAQSASTTDTNCHNRTQVRFKIDAPGGESMYQLAVAAFVSGHALSINLLASQCISGYPRPWYMGIIK